MTIIEPDKLEQEMRDLASTVRNTTVRTCIKIVKLCKSTEEAERQLSKLLSS